MKDLKRKIEDDEVYARKIQKMLDEENVKELYKLQQDQIEKEEPELEWISSHLDSEKIIWSSNPEIIPPSLGYQPLKDSVINTFLVQQPQKSTTVEMQSWVESIGKAAKIIEECQALLVIAGAGMGVDSGLPDYRSPEGFWKAYPPLAKLKISLEDISHPKWFETDPSSAWGFYSHRAMMYQNSKPHDGFQIIKEIVMKKKNNYFIFTSNIDGQFQKAGFPDDKIYECHGSLIWMQCINCEDFVWQIPLDSYPAVDEQTFKVINNIPHCPKCKGVARPNVSMFGDNNFTWVSQRSESQKDRLLSWLKTINLKEKFAILEIGCGVSLHSISIETEMLVNQYENAQLIRINPNNLNIPKGNHISIGLGGKIALQSIYDKLQFKIKET